MADSKTRRIETGDGSYSLEHTELNETYHSRHGALQESLYVFIQHGLELFKEQKQVAVFEMGFGTGLNALLTAEKAKELGMDIYYESIETYPVSTEKVMGLNYASDEMIPFFQSMHDCPWEVAQTLDEHFTIRKREISIFDLEPEEERFDLVYYDAFGFRAQPDAWESEHFVKMYKLLKKGGVLITYCAKGQVRRDLAAAGFEMERLPGPPGKRHMLRGRKR